MKSVILFSSLEKYIPKPILNRESGIPSGEEKVINGFLEEAE